MGIGLPSDSFKNIVFVFALLLCVGLQEGYGQSAGDIAFTGFNGDGDDDFAIVALKEIPANTEIFFTDQDWNGSTFSGTGDTFSWISGSSAISAGTVITFNDIITGDRTVSEGSYNGGSAITLKVSNAVIFAYMGSTDNPTTFLASVATDADQYDGTDGTLNGTGLIQDDTAILLSTDIDVAEYTGDRSGNTPNGYLSKLNDNSNWIERNGSNDQSGEILPFDDTDFTVVDSPTISFDNSVVNSSEGSGTVELAIELVESNNTAVEVEVAFLSGSSTANNGDDFSNYSTQTVSFTENDGDGTIKTVSIDVTDDSEFEDSEKAVYQLQNISTGTIISPNVLTLTIEDNDAPDIVINEILYDPAGDANGDGTPDTGDDEFVEFVNNSERDVDISNWTLSDEVGIKYTFPSGSVIPADKAFVVFASPAQGTDFGGAYLFSAGSLQLNNGGDDVILKDDNGNEITKFTYSGSESEESITRNSDITGSFEGHTSADSDDGSPFSPGTKVNGDPFGSDHAIAFRGSEGWRMISSPVQGATFSDFFRDFWMQGVSDSDDPNGDLTLAGWSEDQVEFGEPSAMSNEMSPGKGYVVYVFEDDEFSTPGVQGGFPKIISSNKAENDSPVSVRVTANDSDDSSTIDGDEGWNLLGNPFGTDISVDALITALNDASSGNVNTNIYVWDHDMSGGADYVELSQGEGERIAPFQAFWVRYTQDGIDTNVSLNRSDLASNTGTEFYKNNSDKQISFKLELHGEDDYFDTYTVKFTEDGSTELDRYDGYHLFSLDPNSINLFSTLSNNRLQKNVLPRKLDAKIEIPLSFDVNGRNDLTFRWNNLEDLPDEWEVTLFDKETDREINLRRTEEFEFSKLSSEGVQSKSTTKNQLLNKPKAKDGEPRFVLSVDPNVNADQTDLPSSVKLNPNYPNPFNPTTTIPYEITEEAEVKLTVWNMIGQKVATLVDGMVEAGTHEETWNATNMPSGIYIARFEVGNEVFTRKMTLIK